MVIDTVLLEKIEAFTEICKSAGVKGAMLHWRLFGYSPFLLRIGI